MKIGVEATSFENKITGTNRYITCLLEQLENSPNEIIKCFPQNRQFSNFNDGKTVSSLKRHLYRNFLLSKDLKNYGADCAIFPDYFMPSDFEKPSAVVIHDLSFISHPQFYSARFVRYYNYKIKKTLKKTPFIIAVSEHTKRNITKYLGVKDEDIFIVQGYSKIIAGTQSLPAIKERPYFLYLGHIEPRKNLNFMIEGFLNWKEQNKNDYKLKIAGALWIKTKEIAIMLEKYSRHPDIEFTGYIDEELLSGIFSNASGFIHTSIEEGFGFPVLEAMGYSLPVLCTGEIATAEISSPHSVTIDPYDISSYVDGLSVLSEIAENHGRIKYDIKYSSELMEEQLNNLLNHFECRVKKVYAADIPEAKSHTEAIEKTFIYSGLFNAGISEANLHKQIFDVRIDRNELQKLIDLLLDEGMLKQDSNYIYLNKDEKGFYRKKRNNIDRKKLQGIMNFLDRLPFVSCIAFSGGTSHYGLENHDDIDLFIITKPYTLYLVYLIIHLYSFLTNSRRELCVNYLIDENNLPVRHSQDFYTAHQTISLQAYKNQQMLNRFWKENEWINKFYPNFTIENDISDKSGGMYFMMRPVNGILMYLYKSMYRKILSSNKATNSVVLNERTIKLHTKDNKQLITEEFEKSWKKYRAGKYSDKEKQILKAV